MLFPDDVISYKKYLKEEVKLNDLQRSTYVHHCASSYKGIYTTQIKITLHSNLDPDLLFTSLKHVVESFPFLRACIPENSLKTKEHLMNLKLCADMQLDFHYHDLTYSKKETKEKVLKDIMEKDKSKEFDLENGPLFRVLLIKISDEKTLFVWTYLDLLLDVQGLSIIFEALFASYTGIEPDKILQQNNTLKSLIKTPKIDAEVKTFWQKMFLKKCNASSNDYLFKTELAYEEKEYIEFVFNKCETNKLIAFSKEYNISINAILQSVWVLFLNRVQKNSDVIFGITRSLANKQQGYHLNTLPIKVIIHQRDTFINLCETLSHYGYYVKKCPGISIAEIKEIANIQEKSLELFYSIFDFHSKSLFDLINNDLTNKLSIKKIEIINETNYPLFMRFELNSGCLRARLIYSKSIFTKEFSTYAINFIEQVLLNGIQRPRDDLKNIIINDLPILMPSKEQEGNSKTEIKVKKSLIDIENILLDLWRKHLKLTDLRKDDNFFALGGDSILGIQIASEARQHQIHFSANNLYSYPTIERLVFYISNKSQDDKSYEKHLLKPLQPNISILSPIQSWFFDQKFSEYNLWCQAQIFEINNQIDQAELRDILRDVCNQFSVFRSTYYRDKDQYNVRYKDYVSKDNSEVISIDTEMSPEDTLYDFFSKNQDCINISQGKLIKTFLIYNEKSESTVLAIVVHHLIFDAISWGIFVKSITACLEGKKIVKESVTYQDWVNNFFLSASDTLGREKCYWLEEIADIKPFAYDFEQPFNTVQDEIDIIEILFDNVDELLNKVRSYNVTINELLIAGLLKVLAYLQQRDIAHIMYESHGRETFGTDIDISNTLGWFTSVFPVKYDFSGTNEDLWGTAKNIKNKLREIHYLGHGFGFNKFSELNKDQFKDDKISVSFNFWGNLTHTSNDVMNTKNPPFLIRAPKSKRPFLIDVESYILNKKLFLKVRFSKKCFKLNTMYELISRYKDALQSNFYDNGDIKKYPLTDTQKGILFDSFLNDDDTYLVQTSLRYSLDLDIDRFTYCLRAILNNNEIFNMSIEKSSENDYVQHFVIRRPFEILFKDLSDRTLKEAEKEIKHYCDNDRKRGFNLSNDILIRFVLLKTKKAYFFLISHHHLLLDGWSLGLFFKTLHNIYDHSFNSIELPINDVFYSSYLSTLSQMNKVASYEYWKEQFALSSDLDSGFSKYFVNTNKYKKSSHVFDIDIPVPEPVYAKLLHMSKNQNVSFFSTLLLGWSLLLFIYENSTEISFGVVYSGRETSGIENWSNVLGVFIQTLPFFVTFSEEKLSAILNSIHTKNINNAIHININFNDLCSEFDVKLPDIFSSVIIFDNYPENTFTNSIKTVRARDFHYKEKTNVPLLLTFYNRKTLRLKVSYQGRFFKREDVVLLIKRFNLILEKIPDYIEKSFSEFNFLSTDEYINYNNCFLKSVKTIQKSNTIGSLIDFHVKNNPSKKAVSDCENILHYEEFGRLVHYSTHFVKKTISEKYVAILVERDNYLPILLIALWNCGKVVIPLSSSFSITRLRNIVKQLDNVCIFSDKHNASLAEKLGVSVYYKEEISSDFLLNNMAISFPEEIACIIFTSGTTGKPKGIKIYHASIFNCLQSISKSIAFNSTHKFLFLTDLSFDISLLELFLPLLCGGCVVISDTITQLKVLDLVSLFSNVDFAQLTPTVLSELLSQVKLSVFKNVNLIIGGETLSKKLSSRLLNKFKNIWQAYGPTETTIWSTITKLKDADTIGKPIDNTLAYVLSPLKHLLPPKLPGELYIAGHGVAKGYLSSKETSQKFLKNIHGSTYRVYKTGDLAWWNESGELHFYGRNDQQIKYQGRRIELEEIEFLFQRDPSIENAKALLVHTDKISEIAVAVELNENAIDVSKIDFSLFFFPQDTRNTYDEYKKIVQHADQLGKFKAVWIPERHFASVGGCFPNPAVVCSALSSITDNICLRAGSVVLPLYQVARVAENWAVIDNLSRGRAGFSVSSGWHPRDFVLSPEKFENRKSDLFTDIATLKALLSGKKCEFLAGDNTYQKIEIFPKPYQNEIPLWISIAQDPEAFKKAGALGLNILTHLLIQDVETLKQNIQIYHQALQDNGYDITQKKVTLMLHTLLLDDPKKAKENGLECMKVYLKEHGKLVSSVSKQEAEEFPDEYINKAANNFIRQKSFIGSIETCRPLMYEFMAIGINEFALLVDFGIGADLICESVTYLSKKISQSENNKNLSEGLLERIINNIHEHTSMRIPYDNILLFDTIPKNTRGKINTKVILEKFNHGKKFLKKPHCLKDEIEIKLVALWTSILNKANINVDLDFFQNGGHSLLAIQLVNEISKKFNIDFELKDLFSLPTISTQAKCIKIRSTQRSDIHSELKKNDNTTLIALGYNQRGIYSEYELDRNNPKYNDAFLYKIKGLLNEKLLENALRILIEKNPILKSYLINTDNGIYQTISSDISLWANVSFLNIDKSNNYLLENELEAKLIEIAREPFDLFTPGLVRLTLAQSGHTSFLLVVIHHIITDGFSQKVFISQLSEIYTSLINNQNVEHVGHLNNMSYFDWVNAQKKTTFDNKLDFWRNYLKENIQKLSPNKTHARSLSDCGENLRIKIDDTLSKKVHHFIQLHQITPFIFFLSIYSLTLSKFFVVDSFCVGTPFENRLDEKFKSVIGFFVNLIPIHFKINWDVSFIEFVSSLKNNFFEILTNADCPFEKIIDTLKLPRNIDTFPLFQTVFEYYEYPSYTIKFGGSSVELLPLYFKQARFLISFAIEKVSDEFYINLKYDKSSFDVEFIENFSKSYITALSNLLSKQDAPLHSLCFLPKTIKHLLIEQFNNTHITFNKPQTLSKLLTNSAVKFSGNIAVEEGTHRVTYQQLEQYSNQFANYLSNKCRKKPNIAIIYMQKSIDAIIAICATIKMGMIYLPINDSDPKNRVEQIIKESNAELVIHNKETLTFSLKNEVAVIKFNNQYRQLEDKFPDIAINASNVAYIIYTSGSTGKPKGVAISHRSVVNTLVDINQKFGISCNDAIYCISQLSFDLSIYDIFGSFLAGAKLCLPSTTELDPYLWLEDIVHYGISVWNSVPALAKILIDIALDINNHLSHQALKQVCLYMLSGDRIPISLVERITTATDSKIMSLGGATEASIWSVYYPIKTLNHNWRNIPYGYPLANQQLYILDKCRQLAPPNVPGELYIGGKGIATSYWNDKKLTDFSFINHKNLDCRLYKTGDIAKYNSNGYLEILGREDAQVKINGFRIELDEIVFQLKNSNLMEDALVLKTEGVSGQSNLTAFIYPGEKQNMLINDNTFWKLIYDDLYNAENLKNLPENFIGWINSRNNKPYSKSEMKKWLTGTVEKLLPYATGDVCELGCGTGLLIDKLSEHINTYYACDISMLLIEKLSARYKNNHKIKVTFGDALEISKLRNNSLNLIIINSVVQYFPNVYYLLKVISKSLQKLSDGGVIFIGDIINKDLEKYLYLERAVSKNISNIDEYVEEQYRDERELFISPDFFKQLHRLLNYKIQVEVTRKNYLSNSEMSLYRYDVLIKKSNRNKNYTTKELLYNDFIYNSNLNLQENECILVKSIPDKMLLMIDSYINSTTQNELNGIRAVLDEIDFAKFNYKLLYSDVSNNYIDLLLYPLGKNVFFPKIDKNINTVDWIYLSNNNKQFSNYLKNINHYLANNLPNFMIPNRFIIISDFQLNKNGKIDRDALSDLVKKNKKKLPLQENVDSNNRLIDVIRNVWTSILQVEQVNIDDNFFDLGGDSVLVLQMIARLKQFKINVSPRIFYNNQTIGELISVVQEVDAKVADVSYEDEFPLHPMQRWLFSQKLSNISHWNQAFLFDVASDINFLRLKSVLEKVFNSHKSFSLRFSTLNQTQQYIRGSNWKITYKKLSVQSEDLLKQSILKICRTEQALLNINLGPLTRAVYIEAPKIKQKRLLLLMHNLIFDGVSWRIILDDIYLLLKDGLALDLPREVSSYQNWISSLQAYSSSAEFQSSLDYWKKMPHYKGKLCCDFQISDNLSKDEIFHTFYLSRDQYLSYKKKIKNYSFDSLLITSLYISLVPYLSKPEVTINVEQHGREHITDTLDLSRTTGWFTSIFPFSMTSQTDPLSLFYMINSSLTEIKNSGLDYGVAVSYVDNTSIKRNLLMKLENEICFNFFGSFDESFYDNKFLCLAPEKIDHYISPKNKRAHKLHINIMVLDGQLRFDYRFSRREFRLATIKKMATSFLSAIDKIISLVG